MGCLAEMAGALLGNDRYKSLVALGRGLEFGIADVGLPGGRIEVALGRGLDFEMSFRCGLLLRPRGKREGSQGLDTARHAVARRALPLCWLVCETWIDTYTNKTIPLARGGWRAQQLYFATGNPRETL